jgi:O-antigen ligase
VLALSAFFLTVQLVTKLRYAVWVVRGLLVGSSMAAFIGLALYAVGPGLTLRVLTRLVPYGYPGGRIVRYIEDDPARPMRAVGTSVDPNSYGGLLMVGFVLAAGSLLLGPRIAPRWLAFAALGLNGAAMLLTYSRGAWVGAFVGLLMLIWFLDRRWLFALGVLGLPAIALGIGSGFVERLWLGFTLQDPATKLRLEEYQNALAIIREHPWFGVGFGEAPSIELQVGVSSIYLTIAEQAGLVGLAVFLVVVAAILWRACGVTWREPRSAERRDLVVVVLGAWSAALLVGLVDHYFFNIRFAHMAALFWTLAGLLVALTSPPVSGLHKEG